MPLFIEDNEHCWVSMPTYWTDITLHYITLHYITANLLFLSVLLSYHMTVDFF